MNQMDPNGLKHPNTFEKAGKDLLRPCHEVGAPLPVAHEVTRTISFICCSNGRASNRPFSRAFRCFLMGFGTSELDFQLLSSDF